MILLIGNYPLDRQQSMQRFAMMLLAGLKTSGIPAELIQPSAFFGRFRYAGKFVAKWLAYLDKFVLFPRTLAKKLRERPALVHICDHSNAMYARASCDVPVVVTCHDLLAVRGALGEDTGCPASATGKRRPTETSKGDAGIELSLSPIAFRRRVEAPVRILGARSATSLCPPRRFECCL